VKNGARVNFSKDLKNMFYCSHFDKDIATKILILKNLLWLAAKFVKIFFLILFDCFFMEFRLRITGSDVNRYSIASLA